MDRTLAFPLGSYRENTRMRRICQFTSLVFAIVAVTCGDVPRAVLAAVVG